MISYIDIAFVVIAVIMTIVGAKRGLVVSLIGMLRFIFIVPVSYLLTDYLMPYVPKDLLNEIPQQARGVALFFVVFIALIVLTGILMFALKKLQDKKGMPLRHTNAFLGGVFGFVKALVLISVLSLGSALVIDFIPKDNQVYEILSGSYIVEYISNLNLDELKAVALQEVSL